jgi:small conductance mechanosensitive channel
MDTIELVMIEIRKTLASWLATFAANLPNILVAVIIIIIFYCISIFLTKWLRSLLDKSSMHASLKVMLISMAKTLLIIFGIFFALGIVGLEKTVVSLMAGVGVIGLALGFAFKDLASNLISGLFIAIQNPFDIGDTIKVNNIVGTVEMIRLRDTIINPGNGQKIYIPNKSFMEDPLYNYSQTGEKLFQLTIGVSYEDDIEQVITTLQRDLKNMADVKKGKDVTILIKDFGPYSVILEIDAWVTVPGVDQNIFTNRAMSMIKKSLEQNGFHVPLLQKMPT